MMKNSLIRKYSAILALSVSAVMLTHTACAKEPFVVEPAVITMTTEDSQVRFIVGMAKGTDKSDNLTIDWGDGKKGNLNNYDSFSKESEVYVYTRNYSDKAPRKIVITGNVTSLLCEGNLTALDVSRNPALTLLNCSDNQLTALDVSKNTALKELYCKQNQLTALDVSKNTALERLECNYNRSNAVFLLTSKAVN